jgi:hypothetical protein
MFCTNQDGNVLLLDDPGRVRSQITSVVCQIQRFDFDCNLVVARKLTDTSTAGFWKKSSTSTAVILSMETRTYTR